MGANHEDTTQLVAAILVMRQLENRLQALDNKIDSMHLAQKAQQARGERHHWLSLILSLAKTGITFSGQISVAVSAWFCAGYVWFAHQTYVQEILTWISTHALWLFWNTKVV